jgi:7-cyano-7-deazaguanine tRNA-ribosyltransferase
MSFELRDRDLLGRIGRLRTKSGYLETPVFMPVINPVLQTLAPKRMRREFGCDIVITNSYIIRNHFGGVPGLNVHRLLDYDGVVMTDSGAYQILVYGGVEVSQAEIMEFQKSIGSDIAVILDIPTGWDVPRSTVEYTVDETLRRAREALPIMEGTESLWVGPVQGGRHLDLVAKSAKLIGEMPYQIHALGSPTEVMERYMYPVLVDMTMTAKLNLPPERPLHLFGAGHPMIFAMSVAMGCDLFDSAAYALYAKDDRYLTSRGTAQLQDLQYLPCSCPVCRGRAAHDLKDLPRGERQRLITEHNLHATMAEVSVVKQAIVEGGLWDLVEERAKGHPQMTSALSRLSAYSDKLEESSPGFKGHGVFYYDHHSANRPQVTRHQRRLKANYGKPVGKDTVILLPVPSVKPFNTYLGFLELKRRLGERAGGAHFCFVAAPYGVVPELLAETYPLSQYEIAEPLDSETVESTAGRVLDYLRSTGHLRAVLVSSGSALEEAVERTISSLGDPVEVIHVDSPWGSLAAEQLLGKL